MKRWIFITLFICGTALAIGGTTRTMLIDVITSSATNGDITLTPNGTGDVIVSSGTATTVPYFDASKQLISSAVTPTELGYLTGVTSALQTQLGLKLDDFTGAADNAVMRTDGTGGIALQESGIIVDDSDNVTGVSVFVGHSA